MRLVLLLSLALAVTVDKNRPVTKVIKLLKDMQTNLQKEAEEDEAVYNKLACWCTTNDKAKTQAIEEAESKITQLVSNIEEFTATSARLSTEISNLEKEIAANQQSLDKASAIRTKELSEFNGEEKDGLQSISALKSAITVLSKHHSKPSDASLAEVMKTVNRIAETHRDMLSVPQQAVIGNFLQQSPDYLNSDPTFKQSYAPQSGEVFGILRNMLETFESNLSQSQKDEMAAQAAFGELKTSKQNEIEQGQAHAESKRQEKATADENNANAKEDIEDARNSLGADQVFLMDLKQKCQMTDTEWEQRQKTRHEEVQAVSQALSVLAGDDAHDVFTRTFNFVQTTVDNRRERAANVLKAAATKFNSPVLSNLATQVRLDAFTRVKAAIDHMVTQLLKEKDDEVKHRDFCIEGLNNNDKEQADKLRTKEQLESKIDTLHTEISTLQGEIEQHDNVIAELQKQLKRAGEDRSSENVEFQSTVKDQRETQAMLSQAVKLLQSFYAKKNAGVALAQQEPAGPPPPAGFKEYKNQQGASGVFALLQQIISDAKVMEAEAVQAEKDAQAAYESYVKNTNRSVRANQESIITKKGIKAKKEKSLSDSKADHGTTLTELEELANEAADYHKSCDFVIRNFDLRQEARDQEVDALRQAKSILSGANFGAFLQQRF